MLRGTSLLVLTPFVGWFAFTRAPEPVAPPTPAPLGCHAQIGDFVWNDLNKNSKQDMGEPGIPGVRVVLKTKSGAEITDQITDADGRYCFTDLCKGDFLVCVDESTLPQGFMPAMTDMGDDALDSDPNPSCVTITDYYEVNKNVDFGYCEGLGCRLTGGRNPKCVQDPEGNGWSTGGQVGAPTAQQPQPCGHWTHHQNSGPAGKFSFHAGTNSAPDDTEIAFVVCSDPGNCNPSNAPAPVKQMNFNGVGVFANIQSDPGGFLSSVNTGGHGETQTRHYFDAYVFDGGEPGGSGPRTAPGMECDDDGFEGGIGLCSCPDYYRITIHETMDPGSAVIYTVRGYLSSGNYQMHDPINGNTCD
jgi:hypothetical protein